MAQLPAISITEQPILQTERKINRPGYRFSPKRAAKTGSQTSYFTRRRR